MNKAPFSYAIWPWGTETKQQYINAIRDISEVGYHYYESVKSTINVFLSCPEEFKALNREYGVTPVSFYFHMEGSEERDIGDLESKLPFLQDNGVRRISVQATGVSGRPANREELDYVLRTITRIGEICKPYGVVPCLHPHHNTTVMYESEIDFILQNTDPDLIAFGPDTAHLAAGLCNVTEIFRKYLSRIKFTHMKDLLSPELKSTGFAAGVEVYANFREMGHGSLDFPAVFKLLKEGGYNGYLTAELDSTRYTHRESARINLEYLQANY